MKHYCKSCGKKIYTGDFCDDDCRETYELEKLTKTKGKRWVKC
ncbi:MAG: DUF2116 family Zn-ribbon domain-containing protein [Bacillota bacterium]